MGPQNYSGAPCQGHRRSVACVEATRPVRAATLRRTRFERLDVASCSDYRCTASREEERQRSKKKEGRPLPVRKSPGAPYSTGSGAGSSRFAATTILRKGYSPQESCSCG